MVFSVISPHSPTIVGYPQIKRFSPNVILQLILLHSNFQSVSSYKDTILNYITQHLHPTMPFRKTDYAFTLGNIKDNNPPQVRTTLSFNSQQHIKEQLALGIIETGQPGDWLHSLIPVPHMDENKNQDGWRWVGSLIKVNLKFEKILVTFSLISNIL